MQAQSNLAADISACIAEAGPVVRLAFANGLDVRERVGIIEWAERNIVIDKGPAPGRFRVARTPYLREPLEKCASPGVRELDLMCSTQVGKTLTMLIALGYAIDQDPGDTLYVMPTENTAKETSKERIQPMLFEVACIKARMIDSTRDRKLTRYMFDRMNVYFGWANSPASLASRPCRKSFFDEVGKFPQYAGGEANPVKLANERSKTFWNRFSFRASSPTKGRDEIVKNWEKGDRRTYRVPCPHCGEYQALVWSQVKWDHDLPNPEAIRRKSAAWYECAHCHEKIRDGHKPKMLARGVWCPEEGRVVTAKTEAELPQECVTKWKFGNEGAGNEGAGTEGVGVECVGVVDAPETDHHSYHLWSAYSPFVKFADIAAEWLDSYKDPEDLMNFVNGWLGEPFEERTQDVKIEFVETLRAPYRLGTCPSSVILITAGVDVQKDHCWWMVRGWGPNKESWLIDYGAERIDGTLPPGQVSDRDIEKLRGWLETIRYPGANGELMPIALACWDSAYRTEMVYAATRKSGHVMKPVKGANRRIPQGYEVTVLDRTSGGKRLGTFGLYHLDTEHYKDSVHALRSQQPPLWHLPEDVDATYLLHVSSEHKVIVRDTKGRPREQWAVKPEQPDNHLWDCEVYARAALDICGGVRRLMAPASGTRPAVRRQTIRMPDGRPYFVGNR